MKRKWLQCKNFIRDRLFSIPIRNLIAALFVFLIICSTLLIASLSYNLSESAIEEKTSGYCVDLLNEMGTTICKERDEINSLSTYICYNETIQNQLIRLNQTSGRDYYSEKAILEKEIINMTVANSSMKAITLMTKNGQSAWISQPEPSFTPDMPVWSVLSKKKGSIYWFAEKEEDEQIRLYAGRVIYNLGTQKEIGYFLVRFDEKIFSDILVQKEFFKQGHLFIIDSSGTVISSNQEGNLGKKYSYPGDLSKTPSNYKLNETQEWITLCDIPNSNWKLVSVIPCVAYEKEIIALRKYIFLIASATIVIGIVVVIYLTRKLFAPLTDLCQIMESVGKGNFNITKPYYYQNDIGTLYDYFINMVHETQNLLVTTQRQQTLLQKSELNSLRMQINPHFIYNTLESIKWIAFINHSEEIVTMVTALGNFMRNNISGSEFVTLEKELENIKCYLTIQKLRYRDKFEVEFDIATELLSAQMPKLLLQPLVENAIVHGLEPMIGIGKILIRGRLENSDIVICIIDNGIGFTEDSLEYQNQNLAVPGDNDHRESLGIKNVHQRIQMYYGEKYGLSISSQYGIETNVCLRIPYKKYSADDPRVTDPQHHTETPPPERHTA